MPWIVTNPIYVGRSASPPDPLARADARTVAPVYENGAVTGWAIEASRQSAGGVDLARAEGGGTQVRWRYALGGSREDSPYVALVTAAGTSLSQFDRVMFSVRADKPMRIALQVRVPKGATGDRWQRTFYADDTQRDITIFFDELKPRGNTSTPTPVLADVQALMWVLEPPNTALGTSGQVWIDHVRYGR